MASRNELIVSQHNVYIEREREIPCLLVVAVYINSWVQDFGSVPFNSTQLSSVRSQPVDGGIVCGGRRGGEEGFAIVVVAGSRVDEKGGAFLRLVHTPPCW